MVDAFSILDCVLGDLSFFQELQELSAFGVG